jgi:hypothetical protein
LQFIAARRRHWLLSSSSSSSMARTFKISMLVLAAAGNDSCLRGAHLRATSFRRLWCLCSASSLCFCASASRLSSSSCGAGTWQCS